MDQPSKFNPRPWERVVIRICGFGFIGVFILVMLIVSGFMQLGGIGR